MIEAEFGFFRAAVNTLSVVEIVSFYPKTCRCHSGTLLVQKWNGTERNNWNGVEHPVPVQNHNLLIVLEILFHLFRSSEFHP